MKHVFKKLLASIVNLVLTTFQENYFNLNQYLFTMLLMGIIFKMYILHYI
jgi:hypothetical protein